MKKKKLRRRMKNKAIFAGKLDEGVVYVRGERFQALVDADTVAILRDLVGNLPVDEEKLRLGIVRLADRLSVKAAKSALAAWEKP